MHFGFRLSRACCHPIELPGWFRSRLFVCGAILVCGGSSCKSTLGSFQYGNYGPYPHKSLHSIWVLSPFEFCTLQTRQAFDCAGRMYLGIAILVVKWAISWRHEYQLLRQHRRFVFVVVGFWVQGLDEHSGFAGKGISKGVTRVVKAL